MLRTYGGHIILATLIFQNAYSFLPFCDRLLYPCPMQFVIPALIIAAAIVIVGIVIRAALLRQRVDQAQGPGLTLLQAQVESLRESLTETVHTFTGQVSQSLTNTNKNVGDRLDNTTKVLGDVRQQLGSLEKSSNHIMEIGKDLTRLEDILRPPKLRGSLGELFLADLLKQILPPAHFALQYQFKGGETVDAVIKLQAGMVPIDAKFPLENFRRIIESESKEKRIAGRKAFIKDVKTHIDAISSKYIRMDENTFDFALMYIPAENIYYESIIKDDEFGGEMSLFNYSLKKRVIPVSPNSFYAYLQTIILGLKGMKVEEKSREIIEGLSRLNKEFDNFAEAFRLVGQHLDNSSKKYTEAEKRFGKVESKVEQIDGLAKGLEPPTQPPQLDPPTT
jgi:DNA recombination protein RmuC